MYIKMFTDEFFCFCYFNRWLAVMSCKSVQEAAILFACSLYFLYFYFFDSIDDDDDDNNSIGRCRLFEWNWNVQHEHVFIMGRRCERHTATVCKEAPVLRPLLSIRHQI